jgi:hypothetical protein
LNSRILPLLLLAEVEFSRSGLTFDDRARMAFPRRTRATGASLKPRINGAHLVTRLDIPQLHLPEPYCPVAVSQYPAVGREGERKQAITTPSALSRRCVIVALSQKLHKISLRPCEVSVNGEE